MMLMVILLAIVLLAVLSPSAGADSRDLPAGEGPRRDKLWSRQP